MSTFEDAEREDPIPSAGGADIGGLRGDIDDRDDDVLADAHASPADLPGDVIGGGLGNTGDGEGTSTSGSEPASDG